MGLRDLKNVFKRKEYDRPPAPPPPRSQPNEEPIRDSNPAPTSTQPVNGKDILSNPIATGEPPSLFKDSNISNNQLDAVVTKKMPQSIQITFITI